MMAQAKNTGDRMTKANTEAYAETDTSEDNERPEAGRHYEGARLGLRDTKEDVLIQDRSTQESVQGSNEVIRMGR